MRHCSLWGSESSDSFQAGVTRQPYRNSVVVYDPIKDAVMSPVEQGAVGTFTIVDFVAKLTAPRAVWLMVPSGKPTETTIEELAELFSADDML